MNTKSSIFNTAITLHKAKKIPEAIKLYEKALKFDSKCTDTLTNLGAALKENNQFNAALTCYKKSIMIDPGRASTWTNLGNLYCSMQLFDNALDAHKNAADLAPESPGHLFNKGLVYFYSNKLDEAIYHFDEILTAEPNNAQAHWHKALSLLGQGKLSEGFSEYEWRFKINSSISKFKGKKDWKGEPLENRSILITSEQGFGDIIQFSRYIAHFKNKYRPAKIILQTRDELVEILETLDSVDEVVSNKHQIITYDFSLALLSIPNIVNISIDDIGNEVPYLKTLGGHDKKINANSATKKVGLIWAGKTTPKDRSCRLEDLLPLLYTHSAEFFSFQLGDRRSDINQIGVSGLITDLGDKISNFADTATLMKQMDLLITVDSGPAHLAGALGIKTWVLLLFCSDWRWLLNRTNSPWYPTLKLYRQTKPNCWNDAINQLISDFNNYF